MRNTSLELPLHPPAGGHAAPLHPTPFGRLLALLRENRGDLAALLVFTLITGLLSLAVPLAVQSLVNIIAQGIFLQPLVVLTLLTLVFLLFAGLLRIIQFTLIETLQQRFFAQVALRLARNIPAVRNAALFDAYGPEMVNRFFDVLTVQKTLAKLLLDGLTYALSACGGLILLAFYSPYLFGFDLFVIAFAAFVLFGMSWGGLRTSLRESVEKYRVAGWLEELARCQISFKMNRSRDYLLNRADALVVNYLTERRAHFGTLLRQAVGQYLFQAVASAGVLAIGGWLVINRQLTLGQLVAAQLVVVSALAALEKLVQQAEHFYDLLTGLEKVGHLLDLPTERESGIALAASADGARVQCRDVYFGYHEGTAILTGLNLTLEPGARLGVVGASGAGKSTLVSLICGLNDPHSGSVEIDRHDVRDLNLDSLRSVVALITDNDEIFDGTVAENVAAGRPQVTYEAIQNALELACLSEEVARMPEGIQTRLVSGGQNLSRGQKQRLLIARALADNPRLIILDEAFTGIDEQTRQSLLDRIYAPDRLWTILAISHIDEIVMRSDTVCVLAGGKIIETGMPGTLAARPQGAFARLFPFLARQLRIKSDTAPENTSGISGK